MRNFNWLGLGFLTPALVLVVLFFLAPVVLTGFFAFTNMSTATGITGGDYVLTRTSIRRLGEAGFDAGTLDRLREAGYRIDDTGLAAVAEQFGPDVAGKIGDKLAGKTFENRRELERALKALRLPELKKTRNRKSAAEVFKKSILNERFTSEAEFRLALTGAGVAGAEQTALVAEAFTGWRWTRDSVDLLFSLPSTLRYALNTALYVSLTLSFNVLFGLFLAISTFYLPARPAATFRAIWFLPRILPPVLYVLMWKWFTWDGGFIAAIAGALGASPRNWMLDTPAHAWTALVLINGFVGASMGMILFSSAIKSIPASLLYASEVDGAGRWQQIRHIILPQLRWPILFVTAYQTLSLLTSFEYILLATDGGPGRATEVWALAAYHTALRNYGGNLEYGLGAAFALVLVAIGIAASAFYLRLFNFRELVSTPRIEQ